MKTIKETGMGKHDQEIIKPSFGSSFSHGWKVMNNYFLVLLFVVFVLGIILAPTQIGKINSKPEQFFHWQHWNVGFFNSNPAPLSLLDIILVLLVLAYSLLIVPVFIFGANLIFVNAVRNIRPELKTLITGFKENYRNIVLANLLTIALVIVGTLVLIIPGIIIACRLIFVSYLVVDEKLTAITAIEKSWKLTKRYGWTIFFMGFISIFLFIFGLCLFFVGVYPALIWIKSSWAGLYEAVLIENDVRTAAPV